MLEEYYFDELLAMMDAYSKMQGGGKDEEPPEVYADELDDPV